MKPNGLHEEIRKTLVSKMGSETPSAVTLIYEAGVTPAQVTVDYNEFLAGIALSELGLTASAMRDDAINTPPFLDLMTTRCLHFSKLFKNAVILCLEDGPTT